MKQIFFAPFYGFSSSSFSFSFFISHKFGNFTFLHIDHVFTHTRNRLSSKCVKTFEENIIHCGNFIAAVPCRLITFTVSCQPHSGVVYNAQMEIRTLDEALVLRSFGIN